jgi:adenylate kinase family enzyme
MIIGICGLIGSGKGTVADILVENHNFQKISFADKLKDGVAAVYGWDRDMLEGEAAYGVKKKTSIGQKKQVERLHLD